MNDDRTLLPEQIRNLPCSLDETKPAHSSYEQGWREGYVMGHLDARHAAAELAAAALSAAPAPTWAPDGPAAMDAGVRADGTVEDCVVETYLRPLEYVTRAPGFLRVVADDGATNIEIRVPDEALASLGLSAAPAQEPVAMVVVKDDYTNDEFYWKDKGVLLELSPGEYDLYLASPLPQEPQEGKALTDAKIEQAWWSLGTEPDGSNLAGGTTLDGWKRAVRWAERELRGAQEGKAGEPGRQELLAVAQMVIEEYAGGGDWQSVERAARAAMSATRASREGEQR